MNWYTLDNGSLCLGTENRHFANFHIVTEVKLEQPLTTPLSPEHAELIGSYPEDWCSDESIEQKINNTAKHFFGLVHH